MGDVAAAGDSDFVDDESDETRSCAEEEEQTFDPSLPVKHSYLGGDLEELQGRTLLEEDSIQELPLMAQPNIVLLPGQTLPLTVFHPPTVSMLRRTVQGNRTFGVVHIKFQGRREPTMAKIGTTAEIFEFVDEDDRNSFRLKAKGRQRFKVLNSQRQVDGNIVAEVKILPEVILPPPLHDVRLAALNTLRPLKRRGFVRCKFSKMDAIQTPWPAWVYSQYDEVELVFRVKRELQGMTLGRKLQLPSDPIDLSFWVAQNLPLLDEERTKLLKMNSAIQRLRRELDILEMFKVLCCRECGCAVAHQRDVFCMSVEGPQGTYVNPGGYVHEMMTLHKAKGIRTVNEEPSTEYSWFPGYAWTIAECKYCHKHMGWKFTAASKDLKPPKFWGLTINSVKFDVDQRTPTEGD